jgi:hypothetical protein
MRSRMPMRAFESKSRSELTWRIPSLMVLSYELRTRPTCADYSHHPRDGGLARVLQQLKQPALEAGYLYPTPGHSKPTGVCYEYR